MSKDVHSSSLLHLSVIHMTYWCNIIIAKYLTSLCCYYHTYIWTYVRAGWIDFESANSEEVWIEEKSVWPLNQCAQRPLPCALLVTCAYRRRQYYDPASDFEVTHQPWYWYVPLRNKMINTFMDVYINLFVSVFICLFIFLLPHLLISLNAIIVMRVIFMFTD